MIKIYKSILSIGNFCEKIRNYLENRLLDAGPGGFEGGMTNRKYAGMTHVSRATAQRELADLVAKGVLRPNPGGGRSASYDIAWDENQTNSKS